MKRKFLFLITIILVIKIHGQSQGFTAYNQGTQFVSVEVDEGTNRVWAVKRYVGNSIMKLNDSPDSNEANFTTFEGVTPTGTPLKNYFIRDIAIDFEGNVWVGHYGYGNNNVVGGVEKIRPDLSIKHYYANDAGGGLLTRKVRSIIVDENDKVWVAQYHHRLIETPPGAGSNTTTIWPGTLGWKSEYDFDFHVLGNRYRCSGQPAELPYPRNTFGEIVVPETAERNFQALSSDSEEVWASHWAYETGDDDCTSVHTTINDRILRYSLDGTYLGEIFVADLSGTITNICRNDEKGTWVTSYQSDAGFSVFKNNTWIHITPADFPNILPSGTSFNANATWRDENGKVYLGTNNGLIVYNGIGAVNDENSYKRYTNVALTNEDENIVIFDDTMVSNNIFGGCSDPRDVRVNWIATENGIMKMGIREGVELWHISNYMDFENSLEEEIQYNTKYIANIKDINGIPENEIATVTADGSKSSFIRIYTNEPQEYYNGNYIVMTGSGSVGQINDENYIKQFGKFTIKSPQTNEQYDVSMTEEYNISQFKYVEFIYQHPSYIDFIDCEENEIYGFIDFKIINNNSGNEILNFPFKISRAPILLAHGVWSNVDSLNELENYFISQGYPKSMLIKVWRADSEAAEDSHQDVSWVIPSYIDSLKTNAARDKISAGKVNVVAHSRGGLYTRAYVEDLNTSFYGSYSNRKDVNSLITLDTPHFGSQGANIVLDKRNIFSNEVETNFYVDPVDLDATTPDFPSNVEFVETFNTIGYYAEFSAPKRDRISGGGQHWGARNLLVSNDHISGIEPPEDPLFIKNLNSDFYHSKLIESGVPIHTFSAEFEICNWSPLLCNGIMDSSTYSIAPKNVKVLMFFAGLILDGAPEGLNSVLAELYNNEPNDFIVPKSSMTGGLSGSQNTNYLSTQGNIDHTGMFGNGIAKSDAVLSDIYVLLTRDVNNENYFSKNGLDRTVKPVYNFLEEEVDPTFRRSDNFVSKILINREPTVFDYRIEGDILNFNIYQKDVDRIMVTYEGENDSDNFGYEIKSNNLTFKNPFTYTIPQGYSGKLTITAYGYKNGVVGVAKSTVTLNVGIPASVTLQGIHFTTEDPVILDQDNFYYTIKGMYSDGIERIINNEDITFTIENENILTQVDNEHVKAENIGTSLLKAEINGFEDTVKVKVRSNPSLQQTILTNLYAVPNNDNTEIVVNWETLHEYENASFVLETSYGTPDNFTEINTQAGNGTLNTPAQFTYTDTSFGNNTVIYYRIKMTSNSGVETYSSIIEVNLSTTADVDSNNFGSTELQLYPNPTNAGEVTLKLNSNIVDYNAKLEMYSLQGKRLSKQNLAIVEGNNKFTLKIGQNLTSGIYLIKVSTSNYIKTIKLIIE